MGRHTGTKPNPLPNAPCMPKWQENRFLEAIGIHQPHLDRAGDKNQWQPSEIAATLRMHSQALGAEDVLPGPSMGQDSCWVSSDLFWSSIGKPEICQDIAQGIRSLPWSS